MRAITFFLVLAVSGCGTRISAQESFLSTVYSALFGDQEVRQEYEKLTHRALKDLGVNDPQSVAVKQMNNLGPAFARVGLSSFTAFGIWLDQSYLDQCSPAERIFTIYHEASHYVCRHHQTVVGGTIVGSACLLSVFLAGLNQLDISNSKKYALLLFANLMADTVYYRYLLPPVVKKQEKQADIMAAQALIRAGKKQIVEAYIRQLKQSPGDSQKGGLWWYSDAQRAAYLEKTLKTKICPA